MPPRRSARVPAKATVAAAAETTITAKSEDPPNAPSAPKKPRGRPRKSAQVIAPPAPQNDDTSVKVEGNAIDANTTNATSDGVVAPTVANGQVEPEHTTAAKTTKKRGRPAKASAAEVKVKPEAPSTITTEEQVPAEAGPSKQKRAKQEPKAVKEPAQPKTQRKRKEKKVDPNTERYARVKGSCPEEHFNKFKKAISQRLFMIERQKGGTGNHIYEDFKILGSTGNVYNTRIATKPRCDCPDYLMRGRVLCKHTIFVFIRVLKVPDTSSVWYSDYLDPKEIEQVFAAAPPDPQEAVADAGVQKAWRRANGLETEADDAGAAESSTAAAPEVDAAVLAKRMQAVGDDCPVCYEEMTQDDLDQNLLVYDDSPNGCGKPLHKECFDMWAKRATPITCVWCRALWPVAGGANDSPTKAKGKNRVAGQNYNAMGYLNMAEAAGIDRPRGVTTW